MLGVRCGLGGAFDFLVLVVCDREIALFLLRVLDFSFVVVAPATKRIFCAGLRILY